MNKQYVRLADVFVLAPFLFWASSKTDNKIAKNGLMLAGLLTFVYNGINYLNEKSPSKLVYIEKGEDKEPTKAIFG